MANVGESAAPGRAIVFTQLLAVFVPILTIGGAIYFAGGWAGRIEERLTGIEAKTAGAAAHEARIGQIEFRLNWLDAEKNRDREERKQLDREIKATLDRLNDIVIRLEANAPSNRRR